MDNILSEVFAGVKLVDVPNVIKTIKDYAEYPYYYDEYDKPDSISLAWNTDTPHEHFQWTLHKLDEEKFIYTVGYDDVAVLKDGKFFADDEKLAPDYHFIVRRNMSKTYCYQHVGGTLTRGQTKKWLQKKLRLCQITDRINNLIEGSIKYNNVQIFEFDSWDDEVEEKAEIALDFLLEG